MRRCILRGGLPYPFGLLCNHHLVIERVPHHCCAAMIVNVSATVALAWNVPGNAFGPTFSPLYIYTLIASSDTPICNDKSLALLKMGGVDLQNTRHDLRGPGYRCCRSSLGMPLDVAMEQSHTRVVGLEPVSNIMGSMLPCKP